MRMENKMQVGLATTYWGILSDLDHKSRRIAENTKKDLTVDQVLRWIDYEHFETVTISFWTCASSSQSSRATSSKFLENVTMAFSRIEYERLFRPASYRGLRSIVKDNARFVNGWLVRLGTTKLACDAICPRNPQFQLPIV